MTALITSAELFPTLMCSNPNASIFRRPHTSWFVLLMIPPEAGMPLASTFSFEHLVAERVEGVDFYVQVRSFGFYSVAHLGGGFFGEGEG